MKSEEGKQPSCTLQKYKFKTYTHTLCIFGIYLSVKPPNFATNHAYRKQVFNDAILFEQHCMSI